MTGLDKIIERINEESKAENEAVLKKAREEADRILAEAEKTAASDEKKIIADAEKEAASIVSRADSQAALYQKQQILSEKGNLINQVFSDAVASLTSLSDDEYFKLIQKMLDKYSRKGEKGEIAFSAKDNSRMPTAFKANLAPLTLANEKPEISGGFILKYGDIEENCTFEALLRDKREELQEEIQKAIF
ncbi:MAG: V-type ATP synthase subunit E [Lachnospiraceae bacterium]|nr:V-type ATP synthase subunit E [Lachnospiraceae bacterium]